MFGSFIKDVKPKDVYVAATVDQGRNVVNACKSLGIEILLCRAHRINSAVMWMLGIAGSAARCQNRPMKDLITRAAALVGIFSHSAVNNDALRAIQRSMQEEELKEELELMAAEAGSMAVAAGEAQASASLMGSSQDDSLDSSKMTFDVLNLLRRNDTR